MRAETGVDLQVLTGDDEARLTFLAVRRWFGWSAGRLLVLDIGGGSLEIAAGIDEEPDARSLPLGAGRLTRELAARRPAAAKDVIRPCASTCAPRSPERLRPFARFGAAGPRGRHVQDVQAAGPPRRRRAVGGGPLRRRARCSRDDLHDVGAAGSPR